jgi:hypothetical protein
MQNIILWHLDNWKFAAIKFIVSVDRDIVTKEYLEKIYPPLLVSGTI